jgi:Na+-transporting NADH:ubiquinone oxidoreductase subunit NqrA
MQLRLKKWSDLNIGTESDASVEDVKQSATVTLLGGDYQGTKFQILADEGVQVLAGQAVICDRRHPQLVFTSPVTLVARMIWSRLPEALNQLPIISSERP